MQHWYFESNGNAGGEVTVTVRCSTQDHPRQLVGHLTMQPYEWTVFQAIVKSGTKEVSPAWATVESRFDERRRSAAQDS